MNPRRDESYAAYFDFYKKRLTRYEQLVPIVYNKHASEWTREEKKRFQDETRRLFENPEEEDELDMWEYGPESYSDEDY